MITNTWFRLLRRLQNKSLPLKTASRASQSLLLLAFMLALTLTTGCVKISGTLSKITAAADFKKSQMFVLNSAVANGVDQLQVDVRLMNSDGSVVEGFTPEFSITQGAAVLPSQCFLSDKNGISICVLKSMTAGQRMMKMTNVVNCDLQKTIQFLPIPLNNNQFQALSGGATATVAGNYKVSAAIGNITSPLKQSAGPYTFYLSVPGALSAQVNR